MLRDCKETHISRQDFLYVVIGGDKGWRAVVWSIGQSPVWTIRVWTDTLLL